MIARGIRMTPLRREILGSLTPGQGAAADELKRRVALGRGLAPESTGWAAFLTSYARAIRLLERQGTLEVARDERRFGHLCASWIRLTPAGERERERILTRRDQVLVGLEAEPASAQRLEEWHHWISRASESELASLEQLLAREWRRRSAAAVPAASPGLFDAH